MSDERQTGDEAGRGEGLGSLLRHTSIYAIAPLVQRVLSLVLVALYTKKLSTGEYGLIELVDLFLGLLPLLVGTSLVAALSRHYFLYDDERDRRAVVSSTAISLVLLGWIGATLALVFREPLAELLFAQGRHPVPSAAALGAAFGILAPLEALFSPAATALAPHGPVGFASQLMAAHAAQALPTFIDILVVSTLVVPFAIGTRVGIEYLQVEKRSRRVVEIQISKTLLEASLKLAALYVLDWGVVGFVLSVLVGEALFGTGLLIWTLRRAGARFDGRIFRGLVGYALPLVPVGLAQMLLHQADRLLILHLGPQDLVPDGRGDFERVAEQWNGIYGLGYKIPFLFHVAVLYSFMRIWHPHVFGLTEGTERRRETRRVGTLVTAGLAMAYAQVAIFAPEGVRLLGQQEGYHAADQVVPLIAGAYLLYAMQSLGQAALMSVLATRILAAINGLACVVNVALNLWLIPLFGERGYLGAAWATVGTFAFLATAVTLAASRRLAMPFDPRRAILAGASLAGAAWAAAQLGRVFEPWSPAGLAAKAALAVVTIVAVGWTCVDPEARGAAWSRVRGAR